MPLPPFDLWQRVADDAELLRRAEAGDPTQVTQIARLRKRYATDEVAAALDLLAARRKAAAKFPDDAGRLIADPAGVEQATSRRVADHKAAQFRSAGITNVLDLGCGIGGDAMGFTAGGLEVLAVDRDPTRAAMAGHNARCAFRVADAAAFEKPNADPAVGSVGDAHAGNPLTLALHLDPARRTDAGRIYCLADHEPPPEVIRQLQRRYGNLAIKLSPAVDLAELADTYDLADTRLEFISDAGQLVQSLLWTHRLAALPTHDTPEAHVHPGRPPRTATLLTDDGTHQLHGIPSPLPLARAMRYLFTVDAAAERAGLMHSLDLPALHPQLGLLTGDDLAPLAEADPRQPWLTGFELLADLPWHHERPRQVIDWLTAHDAGLIEVKTRGKAVDPDRVQLQLRGRGSHPFTVFILRFDQPLRALVTRRLSQP